MRIRLSHLMVLAALLQGCPLGAVEVAIKDAKASPRPSPRATESEAPSPSPVASPSPTPTPTPTPAATASPSPSPSATPTATPLPTPSPSPTPSPTPTPPPRPSPIPIPAPGYSIVSGAAPPVLFPFRTVGSGWTYDLSVKAGAFPLSGTVELEVVEVTAAAAKLKVTTSLDSSLFGGGNQPKVATFTVPATALDPYAFFGCGTHDPQAQIELHGRKDIELDQGTYPATLYTLTEVVDTKLDIVAQAVAGDGTMLLRQIQSDAPLDLDGALPIPPGVQLGATITGWKLKAIKPPKL
ncbi:MAG: hypothetical protein JWM80_435 [Cyanobacteria bacterium RYN_339]|nr:hypothetical protein [Cyanobacteria bacterium RYN_339]